MANVTTIESGPSKYDLMLALFDRCSARPRPVTFTFRAESRKPVETEVHVEGVEIEDGSGESWIVTVNDWNGKVRHRLFYSTRTRTGTAFKL